MPRQGLPDKTNTGSGVRTDSAYRSKQNEAFPACHGFVSHAYHRTPGQAHAEAYPPWEQDRGNKTKVKAPRAGRARLCRPEARDGYGSPPHRSGPRKNRDRHDKHRLQHPPPGPTAEAASLPDHRTCPFNSNQERSESGARRCIRNTRPVQMTTPRQNHRKSDEQAGLIEALGYVQSIT